MRKIIQLSIAVLGMVAITADIAMAQRGRGGGGGRAGGGASRGGGGGFSGGGAVSRPSPATSRSPAMSRPSPSVGGGGMPNAAARPSVGTPGAGARPGAGIGAPGAGVRPGAGAAAGAGARPGTGARPSAGDLQGFLNLSPSTGAIGGGVAGRPSGANLGSGMGGGAAAAFLQEGGAAGRPSAGQLPAGAQGAAGTRMENRTGNQQARAENRAGNQTARSENRATNQAGRVENRQQLQDDRFQRRDEVRDQVQDNYPRLDFWSDYPGWAAMRITRPYRWATWGAVAGWVGYGVSEPVSYSYGETIYYEGDTVYQGGQPVASTEEYTQQAEAIVASAPEVAPANADWLPLGVFALSQDGQPTGPAPTIFLQLAISKEGVIRGTLNNTLTGKTQDVEGMVDKKSQRCAWTAVDQSRPIMETGISSLTQDTAPALVHFADGQTQQWLMVRLEEPAAPK
ncbi:MAG: hypothetical protein ACK5YR_23120 [Pirellula sp.]|jgi:hypothetical protein